MLLALTRWDRISIWSVTKSLLAVHRITHLRSQVQGVRTETELCGHRNNAPSGDLWHSHHLLPQSALIEVNGAALIDLETGKATKSIQFDTGNLGTMTGAGRSYCPHPRGHRALWRQSTRKMTKATALLSRFCDIFVIGKLNKPWISLC